MSSATQFRAPGTTKTYELSTPCPSAPPPDLDGAKTHSQTGASWGTALWSTCQNHPGQRTTHSAMNHFAHTPTRRRARQTRPTAVVTALASPPHVRWDGSGRGLGCEWARVCTCWDGSGRRCWPWHGRGACERAPWACGARPSPCHTGHACTHALFTTRPLGATASPTAHGASTTPLAHAHTQFKLTNEQLIKTCTLERQHTPTPPPPHHHHATTQQHNTPSRKHTNTNTAITTPSPCRHQHSHTPHWQRKTYTQ
jgi:hypothetical protein